MNDISCVSSRAPCLFRSVVDWLSLPLVIGWESSIVPTTTMKTVVGYFLLLLLVCGHVHDVTARVSVGRKAWKRGRQAMEQRGNGDDDGKGASENDSKGSFVTDYVKKIDCNIIDC